MGNGYVKKLKKWSSKVTYAREVWPRKFKYLGGIISGRRREKYRTQKFEFVTEVAVPFFRPLVAPHDNKQNLTTKPLAKFWWLNYYQNFVAK